jgi:hypothetical protein
MGEALAKPIVTEGVGGNVFAPIAEEVSISELR